MGDVWFEKYRPKKISDCVLPISIKEKFKTYIEKGEFPNLLLVGTPGVGKTTIARAMLEELNMDVMEINGSLHGNIDTLRVRIQDYASKISLLDGGKCVILDEADHLNPTSTQPALRNFMETFSVNCSFILTANFKNKILDALQSRCSLVEFSIPSKEKPKIAAEFLKRCEFILQTEDIKYDKKDLVKILQKHFPDFRRVINELEGRSHSGELIVEDHIDLLDGSMKELVDLLRGNKYSEMRKWVGRNSDIEPQSVFSGLYRMAGEEVKDESIPPLIVILADYQYKSAFVADHEVNLVACLTEIMTEVQFK